MSSISPVDRTIRLSNFMQMVREDLEQRIAFKHLHQASEQHDHRKCAIQWIKFVCQTHKMSSMSRDSAIQILDTYLALKLANVPSLDSSFVSHAAVISLTLAFKIHESQRSLYLSSFQDFDLQTLKTFEITMLNELGFNLTPQLVPIGFVHELLHVWQPTEVSSSSCSDLKVACMNHQKTELIRIADRLIAGFWEGGKNLLFVYLSWNILSTHLFISSSIFFFSFDRTMFVVICAVYHCHCRPYIRIFYVTFGL